ncbi:MAG: rod shape-determining protein RodA [Armatimonadetes bacterium]|nr:rod shape-determining protein RodA [Armatimonadota bacterium]
MAIGIRVRKGADPLVLGSCLGLMLIGLTCLVSVSVPGAPPYVQKQVAWALLGLPVFAAMALTDPARLARWAKAIYITNIGLLLAVAVAGKGAKGAVRWIMIGGFQFQPSEFSKLAIIICLAAWLAANRDQIHRGRVFLRSLGLVLPPILLVMKQPDLGTGLVTLFVWAGMTFIAGARLRHFAYLALAGLAVFSLMWRIDVLLPYQKHRIMTFIAPQSDPKEKGYHVIQSRIAVGSGELFGKGLRKGTQVHGRFIPESQTDFVFTVIAEEGGFVASVLVVCLFGLALWRITRIAEMCEEPLHRLMAAGIWTMLLVHMTVNIGMTLGIMPVAGVPLPFVSYGGTALMLNLGSLGLLTGISTHRDPLVF